MMNYDTGVNKKRGFIALMATIIISLILLVMVVSEGTSGWYARFNILGTEAKEQANALAEGCADQALAALVTNPAYTGDSTSTTPGGTCHTFPIQFDTPAAGLVTIATQAQVRGSFANLAAVMNMASVHLGSTPASPTRGTLMVYTHVVNDNGGAKTANDFTENVAATAPSKFLFAGQEGGVAVTMTPGSYSISQNALTGYTASLSAGCAGTIAAGEVKSCVITNDDVLTTLTVIANVINNNGGIHPVGDFTLYIDGVAKTPGQPYTVAAGPHTVSGVNFAGYSESPWGYNCSAGGSVTVNTGDQKTCIITYDDNPPAAPACADTVMMLDRTGSMSSSDLSGERSAESALINLYAGVPTHPLIGGGIFGDGTDNNGLAPARIVGTLNTSYSSLISTLNSWLSNSEGNTNLGDAITKANNELNSARHDPANEKVLILVSDGEPNRPSGSAAFDTGLHAPASTTQNGAGDFWSTPAGAFGAGEATSVASAGKRQRYALMGLGTMPAGSAIAGIEAQVDAWATAPAGATTTLLTDSFGTGSTDSTFNEPPAWTEGGSGAEKRAFAASGNDSVSPGGGRFAVIEDGGWICQQVNASGLSNLQLSYFWRGDSDAENAGDQGVVEYRTGGSCASGSWTTVKQHDLSQDSSWSTQLPFTLPAALNNTTFFLRFRSNGDSNEFFRVDNVLLQSAPAPAVACQVGVDLSWNGGASWSSEKTQTLTDDSAPYMLGSGSDKWGSHSWVLNDFSDANFRARLHGIDPGPACDNAALEHVDGLSLKVHYTQATDPTSFAYAAADAAKLSGTSIFTIHFGDAGGRDLLAKLASGPTANAPHQPGSFSDAGAISSGNTGLISPASQASDSGGDGNGFESNPANALADGSGFAANNNGSGDRHRFWGYNFNLPPGAAITGISVRLDWWLDSTQNTNSLDAQLSWNGGSSWSSTRTSTDESTNSSNTDTVGGSSDTWGRTWSAADFSSANFRVRLTSNSSSASRDFFLDWVPVTVYYTVNAENGDGDDFFIAPTAADMLGIFEFIGAQVCPAAAAPAAVPPPTTATLLVSTLVTNDNGGSLAPDNFTTQVSATNASQTGFAGSSGTAVTIDPGSYSVTETGVSGYTERPSATCSSALAGPIAAGETRTCVLVNDDIPPPPPPPNLTITTGSFGEVPDAP